MKTRTISAVIMVALFTPILILGGNYYRILGILLGLIGMWEMLRLEKNIPIYLKSISLITYLYLIINNVFLKNQFLDSKVLSILFFIFAFTLIIGNKDIKKYSYKNALWCMIVPILNAFLFSEFINLRFFNGNKEGVYIAIYSFLITVFTDMFAYFIGKKIGKNKLCKEISPNKTWEGSIGGSIIGTIVPSVFYILLNEYVNIPLIIVLTFILTIYGQVGDLFFSAIKREHGIKDFSNIIPGHGGILDRLDSNLFVATGIMLLFSLF